MIVFKRAAARPLAESWELRQVLEELRREQAKIPNVGGHVFTRRNGRVIKNVREAWQASRCHSGEGKAVAR